MTLREIKEKMQSGDIRDITAATGLSRQYINDVLNGYYINKRVVTCAEQLITRRAEFIKMNQVK